MGSDKFCLRWNDLSNISGAFRELREDKDFFDVTLACDVEQIQAHKVILSACSTFFRNVLRSYPHQHPLLYLKGVRFTDLQAVLNFMYHGEVNVAQEELNSFLAVAEDLKVKGLTQNQNQSVGTGVSGNENICKSSPAHNALKSVSPNNSSLERDNTPKRPRPGPVQAIPPHLSQTDTDYEVQEVVPVKSEPRDAPTTTQPHHALYAGVTHGITNALATPDEDYQESYEEYDQYGAEGDAPGYDGAMVGVNNMGVEGNKGSVNELLQQITTEEGRSAWKCLICGKDFLTKGNVGRHIETMHYEAPTLECEVCGKVLKNKNSYQNHMYIVHGHKKRGKHF